MRDQKCTQTRDGEHRPRLRASTRRHGACPTQHPRFAARSTALHCRSLSTDDDSMRAMHGSTPGAAECTARPLVRETTRAMAGKASANRFDSEGTTYLILRARVKLSLDAKNSSGVHVSHQSLIGRKSTDTWVFPLPVSICRMSAGWCSTLIWNLFEAYNHDRVPFHAPFEHLLLVATDVIV